MSSHPADQRGQTITGSGVASTASSPLCREVVVDTSTFTSPTTETLLRVPPRSLDPWYNIREEEVVNGGAKGILS